MELARHQGRSIEKTGRLALDSSNDLRAHETSVDMVVIDWDTDLNLDVVHELLELVLESRLLAFQ